MADMHRPGRICRHVFDVHLGSRADRASAVSVALTQNGPQRVRPGLRLEREIDEARTGDLDHGDQIVRAQFRSDQFGEVARFGLGFLRQHHRGIGRHIAVRGVARRLHHDLRKIDIRRPSTLRRERSTSGMYARKHVGEKMLR